MPDCPKRWTVPIIRDIWRYVYKRHGNCVIGITGDPNTGKSWTGDKIAYTMLPPSFTIKDYLCFSIEDVFRKTFAYVRFNGKPMTLEMIYKIENIEEWLTENQENIEHKRGRVIMLDEAGVAAYVREFFSKDNKNLSKLLQLWRFLEMIVIIVVPGSMSLTDSTVSMFLNIEIKMLGINQTDGYAWCVAYERIGWNAKKKEPVRRRLRGCRYSGSIKIKAHDEKRAADYDKAMFFSKFGNLMTMAKDYRVERAVNIGQTRSIKDDVKYVKEHLDEFKYINKRGGGLVNPQLIVNELEVSNTKARRIKAVVERDMANCTTIRVRDV